MPREFIANLNLCPAFRTCERDGHALSPVLFLPALLTVGLNSAIEAFEFSWYPT